MLRRSKAVILLLALTVLLSSCKANQRIKSSQEREGAQSEETFGAMSAEEIAETLLSKMTLEEKIGQMMQVERADTTPSEIKKYAIGSVLNGGGSVPDPNTPEGWAKEIERFQKAALDTRLGIPLLWGADGVHGHNNLYGATIFPHNIGLGSANDPELMTKIGRVTAKEMTATGVNWDFAPCLANPMDIRWGRTYEGYGQDITLVSELGGAYVKGLSEKVGSLGLTATAKHYIGEGYTEGGKNMGNAVFGDFDTALEELLRPYDAAIKNGALTVMISFSSNNGKACHSDKYIITDVLKGKLGFNGIVVSDYEGVARLKGSQKEQLASAVNAGVDMLMAPYSWRSYIPALIGLVEDGTIAEDRINDAVRRILTVKAKIGLFENAYPDRALINEIGSTEHREVARQAVRESLVLLKNEGDALGRLRSAENILVTGIGADNIGMQCGGWTITWQGGMNIDQKGTTFLTAIQAIEGKNITHSESGAGAQKCDAIIVVTGEKPYAESNGDVGNPNNPNRQGLELDDESKTLIANLKKENPKQPLILILYSGRPLVINEELSIADSVIAAWLPGSEGSGITDVLFGDYKFTGKLTYPWPRDSGQTSFIFDVGYGLES